jgi:hypothetical protein
MRPPTTWVDYVVADRICQRCGLRRIHASADDCIRDLREIICWLQNTIERIRSRGDRRGASDQKNYEPGLQG